MPLDHRRLAGPLLFLLLGAAIPAGAEPVDSALKPAAAGTAHPVGAALRLVAGNTAGHMAQHAADCVAHCMPHIPHRHGRRADADAERPAARDWAADAAADRAVAALLGDGVQAGRTERDADGLGAALPYGFGGLSATPLVMAPDVASDPMPWAMSGAPRRAGSAWPGVAQAGLGGSAVDAGRRPARAAALADGEWVWRGPKGGFVRKLDDSWHLGVNYTRALGLVGQDDRVAASLARAGARPGFLDARRRALVLNMGHSF